MPIFGPTRESCFSVGPITIGPSSDASAPSHTEALILRALPHDPLGTASGAPREPGAMQVLRAAARKLPEAVHEADLANVGEFHALFQLMLGLGLDGAALAERLEVGIATIARYASGTSAPATVHARRGALIETARMVEQGLRRGELQCLAHLQGR